MSISAVTEKAEPALPDERKAKSAILYASAWVPAAVMALSLKQKILTDEGGGYDFVADALGVGNGSALTTAQQLAMLRWDVLVALVAVPLLWIWLIWRLSAQSRFLWSAVWPAVVTLILYIELKTFWEVGTFLPARVLAAGVFGPGRAFAGDYLDASSLGKLGLLLFGCVAASAIAFVSQQRGWRLGGLGTLSLRTSTLALVVIGLGVLLLPPQLPRTAFSRSATSIGILSFVGAGNASPTATDLEDAGPEQLVAAYREVSRAPVPNARSRWFGAAPGYNVLLYLYETLPDACSEQGAAEFLPHFSSLLRTGIVARSHYATYPYSRRAYFSIYSGWYPAHGIRDFLEFVQDERSVIPGLVSTVGGAGYATMAFVPEVASEWEDDVRRYRALGFQQHLVPPNAELALAPRATNERVAWQRQRDNDSRAMLIKAITSEGLVNRPWLAAFNPQITHGPWPDAATASSSREICDRGLPLFREVDAGLGEILAALERTGQRDRTIVVALGDHGLRTSVEYPRFRGATLDEITFHVPLVIHVPNLLPSAHEVPWPTSHVDIAPSILDLLGIANSRAAEQGSPMWDERLTGRRIFVYAQGYLGADGYVEADRAVMLNYFLGGVAETPWRGTLRFTTADLLASRGSKADSLGAPLMRSVALQRLFIRRLALPGDGVASRPAVDPDSTGRPPL